MSRDLETGNGRVNGHRDSPQSGTRHAFVREPDLRDSSGPLFSMYLKIGEEGDNRTAERWQKDAEGILIFTGLFSAAVATLLTVTVLDLKPNSQDTASPASIPPKSAILVNALLFLSLVISLSCALLAMSLQQWARRYVRFTQRPGYSPHKRARVRAFFSDGVDNCHVSWVVEALPTLLHGSLSLFFAGLLVWLFTISHPVFYAVAWWVALLAVAYIWTTLWPIYQHNSPYHAPLSSTIWYLYTGTLYIVLRGLSSSAFSTSRRLDNLMGRYRERLLNGIRKTAEKTAEGQSSLDFRILCSTLDALGEDCALKEFFQAIPGFFDSRLVHDLREHLSDGFRNDFNQALGRFLDRTFSTSLVPESVKSDQLIICLNATYAVQGSDASGVSQILRDILNGERWPELLQSVEMAHSLRRWSKCTDDNIVPFVRQIVTKVIASARERDDERWISLTKAEFGVPDHVLRDNLRHGDSTLLSLLIHVTRGAFSSGSWTPFTLSSLCQFDIRNTRPELQHEFCDLWNEIVRDTLSRPGGTAINILREIRNAFLGLHQGADAVPTAFSSHTRHFNPVLTYPLSYRVCNIASHRPDMTPLGPATTHLTVTVTPTRAAFGSSAASTTQIGDSPCPSPLSTQMEIQRNPAKADIVITSLDPSIIQTASHQTDEASVVLRFPSSKNMAIKHSDHTLPYTHAFLSSTPSPVFTTQRVYPLPSTGLSHQPSQLALSFADADANHVRPEGTMTHPYSSETEETSQVSVAASLPDLHPYPILTIVSPSTGSITPPSFPVPDPYRVLDASSCLTLAATSPRPSESNQRQDMALPCAVSDTSQISSMANPISRSIPSSGPALQSGEEMALAPTNEVPVSDPQQSLITMPVVRSNAILAELPSFAGPTCIPSDHISLPLGSSSSSLPTTRPHSSLKRPIINPSVTPNGIFPAHGDTSDMERPIPMKVFSDLSQSAVSTLDIVASTSPLDDLRSGSNT